ncbi:MAG: hypothetical protein ACRDDL_06505 [Sarcina sp.]
MLTFGISAAVISILSAVVFVGVLMGVLQLISKIWSMDGEKWNILLGYKNGNGAYYLLGATYVLAMLLMLGTSSAWFNMIGLENGFLAALIIMGVVSALGISKFPKMKLMINAKFKAEFEGKAKKRFKK